MSEIIIVKQPSNFHWPDGSRTIQGDHVVGMSTPQSSTLTEYGYKYTGDETEETLAGLDDYAADRLLELYQRCRVAAPEDRPFYDCHIVAWYVVGAIAKIERRRTLRTHTLPHSTALLRAGKTYAVQASDGGLPHSMIGIDTPHRSLSVLGDYAPLAVADNTDLIRFYQGVTIARTLPNTEFYGSAGAGQ